MTDQVNADWTELQVTIPAADTDRAGDIAQMVVPYGIYIEDYSHLEEEAMEIAHIDLIDEDLLKKDRTKSIIHVYISPEENPAEAISFLKERFEAVGIENTITAANCAMVLSPRSSVARLWRVAHCAKLRDCERS